MRLNRRMVHCTLPPYTYIGQTHQPACVHLTNVRLEFYDMNLDREQCRREANARQEANLVVGKHCNQHNSHLLHQSLVSEEEKVEIAVSIDVYIEPTSSTTATSIVPQASPLVPAIGTAQDDDDIIWVETRPIPNPAVTSPVVIPEPPTSPPASGSPRHSPRPTSILRTSSGVKKKSPLRISPSLHDNSSGDEFPDFRNSLQDDEIGEVDNRDNPSDKLNPQEAQDITGIPEETPLDNAERMAMENTSRTLNLEFRFWRCSLIKRLITNEGDYDKVKEELQTEGLFDDIRMQNAMTIVWQRKQIDEFAQNQIQYSEPNEESANEFDA
ncbi:MAG: hypothetical protein Q9187_006113 [Circinaria calcarea]